MILTNTQKRIIFFIVILFVLSGFQENVKNYEITSQRCISYINHNHQHQVQELVSHRSIRVKTNITMKKMFICDKTLITCLFVFSTEKELSKFKNTTKLENDFQNSDQVFPSKIKSTMSYTIKIERT